jgi:hypothetical protein
MFMDITWQDPVTGAHGFVVIDTLVRDTASGGLRMRKGCTLEEVRGLAQGMTRKEAIHLREGRHYVPVGGAKGGIDFDPRAEGAKDILERFLVAMAPIMRTYWALGEDLGVRQSDIDEIIARRGLGAGLSAVDKLITDPEAAAARSTTAFATVVDGVAQDELVGGLGVAASAIAALDAAGQDPADCRAVIQGFGSMGGASARFLAEAGVRIVGIADADGFVSNPDGLDVETLLATRDAFGGIDRCPHCARPTTTATATTGWPPKPTCSSPPPSAMRSPRTTVRPSAPTSSSKPRTCPCCPRPRRSCAHVGSHRRARLPREFGDQRLVVVGDLRRCRRQLDRQPRTRDDDSARTHHRGARCGRSPGHQPAPGRTGQGRCEPRIPPRR